MQFIKQALADVQLIQLTEHVDSRGSFAETFRLDVFQQHCGDIRLVQHNQSHSGSGVLRGLHFQHRRPQGKLVQVLLGRLYDVIVDLRPESATFGQWQGFWLDAAEPALLWVPPGFAHGFYVSEGPAFVSYKCSDYFQPDDQYTLAFDDPALAIDWPLHGVPLLSAKDQQGERFSELCERLAIGKVSR